jgi:TolA-binding protein
MMRLIILTLILSAVAACSNQSTRPGHDTLASLNPAVVRLDRDLAATEAPVMPTVALNELIARYRLILETARDPAIIQKVSTRLAHLEMLASEALQAQSETTEQVAAADASYDTVITNYLTLLAQYPDRASNDEILYQLAKAYDFIGQQEQSLSTLAQLVGQYPNSIYVTEAQFRRGELFFSQYRWDEALIAYAAVVARGQSSNFYLNALYMKGWVQFKRSEYQPALRDFSAVLDIAMEDKAELSELEQTKLALVDDTFRIMSLLFTYLDGAQSIAVLSDAIGERAYTPVLYQRLGALYQDQQRYRDSADTYRLFISRYADSQKAPLFQLKVIEAYTQGRFPSLLLPEKERFVRQYGVTGGRWQNYDDALKAELAAPLKGHLEELSAYYHARAQGLKRRYAKSLSSSDSKRQKVNAAFDAATYWYKEFIATLPDDPQTPEKVFLMAEAYNEMGRYQQALAPYEKVAYGYRLADGYQVADGYQAHPQASEAAYALVGIYGEFYRQALNAPMTPETRNEIERIQAQRLQKKIAYQLRFSGKFKDDRRALAVQLKSAEELMQAAQYRQAIEVAEQALVWSTPVSSAQRLTAWLVIAHSQFDLQRYPASEASYTQVLALLAARDSRRTGIRERIAAAVYKQAETLVLTDQLGAAVDEFLRVGQAIPESKIRIHADFDAASYLLQLKDWEKAVVVLQQFRQAYPKHPFTGNIPAKLVFAYQELKQWDQAAKELKFIWKNDADPEARREALFLSAQLYEKSGEKNKARLAYRDYANNYSKPFDLTLEAQFKLSEYYRLEKDESKRRFWLKKIMLADERAGADRSDRSRYLAASAASVFADDQRWAFNRIKLKAPLAKSLKKKKRALENTLAAYNKTVSYGIEEFATKATFRIAEVYAQLSEDLMDSERPDGLNELELEQYDILLEEQAFPFEENAIEIHEANSQRSWSGTYDAWVKRSFKALASLLPVRYNKQPEGVEVSDEIF